MKRSLLIQAFFVVAVCVLLGAIATVSQAQQTTNKPTTKESADSNSLVGSWLVKQINGQGVVTLDDARPTIEIGSDGSVTGNTGINQFEGIATIDGQALTISRKTKTLLAGPQTLMNQQTNFIAALREVRSFRIDDKGTLHMLDGAGAELIKASPANQPESVPTPNDSAEQERPFGDWLVEDINGQGVVDRAQTTINIGHDGSITGSTGVNRYMGKAAFVGETLTIEPGPATTRMAGSPALMEQEAKFLAALPKVKSFRVDDNGMLQLLDEAGTVLLKASPVKVDFQLSTHVLDTGLGKPGVGVKVVLEKRHQDGTWLKVGESVTNKQGRIGNFLAPVESGNNHGTYRLTFALEDYFKANNQKPVFPEAVVVFKIEDDTHYHIPIVVTPYAISTYRGN